MSKLVIGLTGGIGSGKTLASDWFAEHGINIVDADIIAKEIVAKGEATLVEIQKEFGNWVLTDSAELNRVALRDHIFNNPQARKQLEKITHPAIRQSIDYQLATSKSIYTLLFEGGENGLKKLCQRVLVIDVPVETQRQRACSRDMQNLEQIQKIIDAQISRQDRLIQAHDVATNHLSPEHLFQQLESIHQKYLKIAQSSNFSV